MNATKNLLTNLCNLLVCACEAFRYGLTFLRAILCSRAVLAAKLLAVESQLAACKQRINSKKRRRPRFTASFRLLWVVLSKFLDEWEDLACLMQPASCIDYRRSVYTRLNNACRFPSLLCRKALANPFGGIGMVSKSESSLVLASTSHQDRVFRRDNRSSLFLATK
jgi:hypothetical protein